MNTGKLLLCVYIVYTSNYCIHGYASSYCIYALKWSYNLLYHCPYSIFLCTYYTIDIRTRMMYTPWNRWLQVSNILLLIALASYTVYFLPLYVPLHTPVIIIGGGACHSDSDCEDGTCSFRRCLCPVGWTGPHCKVSTVLNILHHMSCYAYNAICYHSMLAHILNNLVWLIY